MTTRLTTAAAVAELYDVDRATVYRWHQRNLFDKPRQIIASPSGTQDRVLFDVEFVAAQYAYEMLKGLDTGPVRDERMARLRNFRKA